MGEGKEEKKELDENQEEVITFVKEQLASPLASEIEKITSRIDSLNERLPSEVVEIDSLDRFIEKNDKVIVDFSSEYCIPCYKYLGPLERVAQKDNGVVVGEVDVDKNKKATEQAGEIQQYDKGLALPFLVSFRNGEVVQTMTGSPKEKTYDVVEWMVLRLKVSDKKFEKKLEWAKTIAKNKGWRLNPQKGLRDGLIAALIQSEYCPCKGEEVKENICPCNPYKDYLGVEKKIEEKDECCYCGLFCPKKE